MKDGNNKWAKWVEDHYDSGKATSNSDEQELEKMLNVVKDLKRPIMSEDKVFASIEAKINTDKQQKPKVHLLYWVMRIAAVSIGVVFLINYFSPSTSTYSTGPLVQNSFDLPDGSVAHLNGSSRIKYHTKPGRERTYFLEGEAFFEVKKGSIFTVETENGFVQVLGTSFNVKTFEKELIVACKTGKVGVFKSPNSNQHLLLPGDQIRLAKEASLSKIEPSLINNWQSEGPYFMKAPLREVVIALEENYKIDILLPTHSTDKPFTGTFVLNDMDKALKMVFLPMNMEFTLDKKQVIFNSK